MGAPGRGGSRPPRAGQRCVLDRHAGRRRPRPRAPRRRVERFPRCRRARTDRRAGSRLGAPASVGAPAYEERVPRSRTTLLARPAPASRSARAWLAAATPSQNIPRRSPPAAESIPPSATSPSSSHTKAKRPGHAASAAGDRQPRTHPQNDRPDLPSGIIASGAVHPPPPRHAAHTPPAPAGAPPRPRTGRPPWGARRSQQHVKIGLRLVRDARPPPLVLAVLHIPIEALRDTRAGHQDR